MEDRDSDDSQASVVSVSSGLSDGAVRLPTVSESAAQNDQDSFSELAVHRQSHLPASHSQPTSSGQPMRDLIDQTHSNENSSESSNRPQAAPDNTTNETEGQARVLPALMRNDDNGDVEDADNFSQLGRSADGTSQQSQQGERTETQTLPSPEPGRAYQEFFALVDDLRQRHQERGAQTTDLAVSQSLNSLHKSIISLMKGNNQKPPENSPTHKKRRRSQDDDDHKAKKIKEDAESAVNDDENCCPICLEPWSTGGEHRITSLQCGHLFGLGCITKWVDQAKSCPQCKAKAKKSDFRSLFVKKLTAEDTSQRDRAMLLLELEREKCQQLERCEASLRRKLETQEQDLDLMRRECAHMKTEMTSRLAASMPASINLEDAQPSTSGTGGNSSSSSSGASSSSSSIHCNRVASLKKFHTFQKIYISQEGQCRVFDFSKDLGMTVVSQKSSNSLFRGYGIKMLARDFRPLSYQPLHSMQIRDMSFKPGTLDGMLLTCSLDKTVLLSSVNSKAVIQKYSLNNAVWCCAWNTHDTNLFYAGMGQGVVREFDIRRTNAHVRDVLENGGSPINNIQFWRGSDSQGNFFQGLLIAQLQNLMFKQQVRNNFTNHILPQMKAPVMNLCLHSSGKFLASFRPGASNPKCKYEVSDIRMTDEEQHKVVTSRLHAMFDGGNMQAVISRNCLLSRPESEDGLFAVTADHAHNTVNVWDFDQRSNFQTLPCYEKAIDIKPLVPCNSAGDFLGVLTDKDLVLYKWRE